MTLEKGKFHNNEKISNDENSFSKEVFDILKEYKDKPVEKKYFSMVKSSHAQIHNINSFIESNIKNKNRDVLKYPNRNHIRKTINDNDVILIEKAKSMIEQYLKSLGIKGDIEFTLHKVNVYIWDKLPDNTAAYSDGFDIHVNESSFSKLNEHQKLFLLIHELLHNASEVLVKYSYNIDSRKNGKIGKEDNLKITGKGGYVNWLMMRETKKIKSYGEFFNEGVTDLIAIKIMAMYDNGINDSSIIRYIYNVNLIDKMLLYVSEETGVKYAILLDLLIKGYFHGDYKVLQLLQKILGKNFGDTIMNLYSNEFRYNEHLRMKENLFFEKYPFMQIRYSSPESRSNDLKLFLESKE